MIDAPSMPPSWHNKPTDVLRIDSAGHNLAGIMP